jgi:hypothetical protein
MNYEYDVFLSYKHTSIFGRWVEARFLPLFRDYLMEELGSREPPPIFFDRRELRAAEPFPLKIRHALATSRCMVALWTPSYFESLWCKTELVAMLMRERTLGYPSLERTRGLVAGVSLHDGERFPRVAQERTQLKWDCYVLDGEGFMATPEYIRFQQDMKQWVPQIADIVKSAPEKCEQSWLDDIIPTSDFIERTLVKEPTTFGVPVMSESPWEK